MYFNSRSFHLFLFVLLTNCVFGQITSPNKSFAIITEYRGYDKQDSIFFYKKGNNTNDSIATLEISTPDDSLGWKITWIKGSLKSGKFKFDDTIKTDTAQIVSKIEKIDPGGYKVLLTKEIKIDSLVILKKDSSIRWVYVNNGFYFRMLKDSKGELSGPVINSCNGLVLKVEAVDTFYYYEPSTSRKLLMKYPISVAWSSSKSEYKLPADGKVRELTIPNPPLEEMFFYVQASDSFGLTKRDTAKYKPVMTEAKIEAKKIVHSFDENASSIWESDTSKNGEAPLEVKFANKSINGSIFYWSLSDTLYKANSDEVNFIKNDTIGFLSYTYYIPDTYKVTLISESSFGCQHRATESIIVYQSAIPSLEEDPSGFPNVFTPNGDGDNEYFFVDFEGFVSIRKMHLSIFNRWGRKVYEYKGNFKPDYKGWDGYNSLGQEAPEGLYFFIMEVEGWGPLQYKPEGKKGDEPETSNPTTTQKSYYQTETNNNNPNIKYRKSKFGKTSGFVYLFR